VRTEVQEEQIKTGLRGDEKKQFEAICKAIETYADPLAAFVRENYPLLDSHELTIAVDDVFLKLAKKAKEGRFKTDGSLKSLLFRIVRCNATDQLREKYRWRRHKSLHQVSGDGQDNQMVNELSDDEIASYVAQKLSNAPDIAAAWRVVTQEWTPARQVAAIEIVRQFKIWIGTLPAVQRKVAEVMAKHYGDVTDEEISDEIAKADISAPLGSVKSARREIREKFKLLIETKERNKTT